MKILPWFLTLVVSIVLAYASHTTQQMGGEGPKTKRVSTGSVPTLTRTDIVVTWDEAFPDTNYTVSCTVEDTSLLGLGVIVERVSARLAGNIRLNVLNQSLGSLTGTIHCIAIHD